MKCKDCEKFCRYPLNPTKGLCSEKCLMLIEDIQCDKNLVVDENDTCPNQWCQPHQIKQ